MVKKALKNVKLSELVPYENNAKHHTEESVAKVKASIERNEYVTPIIVDESMIIIAGHWRRKALIELWVEKIDVVVVEWLTEKQKADLRITDNKAAEFSSRDSEALQIEFEKFWLDDIAAEFPAFEVDVESDRGADFDDFWQSRTDYDFDENPIKEIKLNYSNEEYVEMLEAMDGMLEEYEVESYSDLLLALVRKCKN